MRSISELFDLKGRTALVTGGAGHLGSTIGLALAECGAKVGLLDKIDNEIVRAKFENINSDNYVPIKMDLSNKIELDDVRNIVKESLAINLRPFLLSDNSEERY